LGIQTSVEVLRYKTIPDKLAPLTIQIFILFS
jgi:hypothetical protein